MLVFKFLYLVNIFLSLSFSLLLLAFANFIHCALHIIQGIRQFVANRFQSQKLKNISRLHLRKMSVSSCWKRNEKIWFSLFFFRLRHQQLIHFNADHRQHHHIAHCINRQKIVRFDMRTTASIKVYLY